MIEFSSTKTEDSKVMPGVTFEFKVMTEGTQTRLALAMAAAVDEVKQLRLELQAIDMPRAADGKIDEQAEVSLETARQLSELIDKINFLTRQKINPIYFNACFVAVHGVAIDGKEQPTAQQVIDCGPANLYQEIVDRIRAEAETSPADRENLG